MRAVYQMLQFFFSQLTFYKSDSKSWYLTIDDSPTENTEWILDLLDANDVKATFFCIGKNVERFPKQFQEIQDRGHQVGYHSYLHKNNWRISFQEFKTDFERQKRLFDTDLYRPPYGKLTWRTYQYAAKGNRIVLWDILTEDWKILRNPLKTIQTKISKAQNGSIFVFHDNEKSFENLKIVLPYFLEYSKTNGRKLFTL